MRYEVSVKSSYVPKWGIAEAIREFGSNALDAEREMGAACTIRYRADSETVVFENTGATMPREALLFGHTTKCGRAEMIGQFGEGLKLGCLAAVRDGYKVRIRSGSEVWVPAIVESKVFPGTDVLAFEINVGRKGSERVSVEVQGIGAEAWDEMRARFLAVTPPRESTDTSHGKLLRDPEHKGRIYVRGVFVERDDDLDYGYDLMACAVDRDRKMVNRWERDDNIRNVWSDAATKSPEARKAFLGVLFDEKADAAGFNAYNAQYLPEEVSNDIGDAFVAAYGSTAVPCATMAESIEMGHLGHRGVVVPKPLAAILARTVGTPAKVSAALRDEVTRVWSADDLTIEEGAALGMALVCLYEVGAAADDVNVVDFRTATVDGMRKPTGEVLIARRMLGDAVETLAVLVHEVCHAHGGDGDKGHVQAMETLWAKLYRKASSR